MTLQVVHSYMLGCAIDPCLVLDAFRVFFYFINLMNFKLYIHYKACLFLFSLYGSIFTTLDQTTLGVMI